MSKELISQLKKIKDYEGRLNADKAWVKRTRAQMLQQLGNTVPEEKAGFKLENVWGGLSIFLPSRLVYSVVRPVATFVLIGAVATSGWIASVSATQNCLPGEVCYGVKLAAEKTQELVINVTGNTVNQTQMHLEFAKRRAVEIQKVVEKKQADAPVQAQVAMDKLTESIQTVQENIKTAAVESPQQVVTLAQDVKDSSKEINNTLTTVANQTTVVNVTAAQQLVKDTSLQAVETVVQTAEAGKVQVDNQVVKDMVKQEINTTLTDNSALTGKADVVVKDVMLVTSTVPVVVDTVSSTIVVSTSTVSTVNKVIVPVQQVVAEVAKAVDQNQNLVKTNLDTASSLVDNNQLQAALQKVKEANQMVQQTTQAVTDVRKIVNETTKAAAPVTTSTIIMVSSTLK